jgi:hypothetical protein
MDCGRPASLYWFDGIWTSKRKKNVKAKEKWETGQCAAFNSFNFGTTISDFEYITCIADI